MVEESQRNNDEGPRKVPEPVEPPVISTALTAAPGQGLGRPEKKRWPLSTVIVTGVLAFVVAGTGGITVGWAIGSVSHDHVIFHKRVPQNHSGPFFPPGRGGLGVPRSPSNPTPSHKP